jgi:hypothetical protein
VSSEVFHLGTVLGYVLVENAFVRRIRGTGCEMLQVTSHIVLGPLTPSFVLCDFYDAQIEQNLLPYLVPRGRRM